MFIKSVVLLAMFFSHLAFSQSAHVVKATGFIN
jgi:hypothetical protein